ncbi:MAG: amidohydrolase [Planctomycetes bacterium]|nr:amidohydrolase [Planctomycetota bacterium]
MATPREGKEPEALLLANASVRTMDNAGTVASSVLIKGDRILHVGEARGRPKVSARRIDLGGKCVLPGFTDSHAHLAAFSAGLARIDLRKFATLDEALEEVRRRAARAAAGEWVLGRGWVFRGWGLAGFPERRMLDKVSPDVPVALSSVDGHVLWVNTAALREAGIRRGSPDPEGGEIERGPDGEPTGILKERAADLLKDAIPAEPPDRLAAAVEAGQSALHALGVTSVHDPEKRKALRAFTRLNREGKLKLRLRYFLDEGEVESAGNVGLEAGFGDDRLRIVGVKAYADGAVLAETAHMLEPYGQTRTRGIPTATPDSLGRTIRAAADLGLPLCVHAIGDAANRAVLEAFERDARPLPFPYRIEHAQHLDAADVPRFGAHGVVASMQPIHLPLDREQIDRALGARGAGAYRFRSLLDSGARLVFGSDAPVADPDPWLGIHAAVNRTRPDGTPAGGWYPAERITLLEAVRAYTRTPAEVAGDGASRGTIEAGKTADLCVVSPDPFEIPPAELKDVRAEMTIFGGEVVHEKGRG